MKKILCKSFVTVLSILLLFSFNSMAQVKTVKRKTTKSNEEKEIKVVRPQIRVKQRDDKNRNNLGIVKDESRPDRYNYLSEFFNINLFVCMSGNTCREGLGFIRGSLHLSYEERNKVFNFKWNADVPELDGILWQVSEINFEKNALELYPPGLIESGIEDKFFIKDDQHQGNFSIDFSQLDYKIKSIVKSPEVSDSKITPSLKIIKPIGGVSTYNIYQIQSKVYFVRIIPIHEGKPLYGSSESIRMRFDNLPVDSEIEVIGPPAIKYPEIYSVRINEFRPIVFPTLPWGSVYITGIDEEKYRDSKQKFLFPRQLFTNHINNNIPYQTEPYKGIGSEGWLESLWNAVSSVIDWVSDAYEWPKEKLAEAVAKLLDALPGIDCGQNGVDCQSWVESTIEAGLVSVGIPPRLPNAEQLLNEGIDYIAAETATQLGCGSLCEDQIKETLKEVGKEFTKTNIALFKNAEEAHNHGREPLFLPDYLNIIPAAEASIQPPVLYLELKRNNIPIEQKDSALLLNYFIEIDNICVNENYYQGKEFRVPVNTLERDGLWAGEDRDVLWLPSDPVARLWHYNRMEIPALDNNKSLIIPVYLQDQPYLFPGHLELIRKHGGFILYDDWGTMYENGKVTFTVKITVLDVEFWTREPYYRTIYSTEASFTLPNYNGGYHRPNRIQ